MMSLEIFQSLFGKTPKLVNGKGHVRMSPSTFNKFKNKWNESKLPNNQSAGYFYFDNVGILEFWG